jgi:hypothetical protein
MVGDKMFEKEVQNTKQKILSFAEGKEMISLAEILNLDIPKSLKDYFNIFAERVLSEELLKILYSKRFDQNNVNFIEARKRFLNSLKEALLFTQEEFENASDKASRFAINFILRPEWTLTKIIFKNENVKTTAQIIESISSFSEYTYYRKLMEKIFERYPQDNITVEFFQRLLRKIDEEVFKNVSLKEILEIIDPIFNFFKFASESTSVPAEAFLIFFRDKGLENLAKEIELEKELHGKPRLTKSDIEIILKRVIRPQEIKEQIQEPKEVESQVQPEIETKIEIEPTPKLSTLPDLNLFFDEKARDKFIKKIFKRDADKFYNAIEKLNGIDNWKEASAFIDSIFIQNEIDPYSDEAVEFTDLVYRRYFPGIR